MAKGYRGIQADEPKQAKSTVAVKHRKNVGAGKVLSVNPLSGESQVFTDIGPTSGLNALTFDSAGNVYISDSFQGKIWKTGPNGGVAVPWASSQPPGGSASSCRSWP